MIVFDSRQETGAGRTISCTVSDRKLSVQDYDHAAKGNPYWMEDEGGVNYLFDEVGTANLARRFNTEVEQLPQAIADRISAAVTEHNLSVTDAGNFLVQTLQAANPASIERVSPGDFFGMD